MIYLEDQEEKEQGEKSSEKFRQEIEKLQEEIITQLTNQKYTPEDKEKAVAVAMFDLFNEVIEITNEINVKSLLIGDEGSYLSEEEQVEKEEKEIQTSVGSGEHFAVTTTAGATKDFVTQTSEDSCHNILGELREFNFEDAKGYGTLPKEEEKEYPIGPLNIWRYAIGAMTQDGNTDNAKRIFLKLVDDCKKSKKLEGLKIQMKTKIILKQFLIVKLISEKK